MLLERFWQHYRQTAAWPLTRTIHSQHDRQRVRESLHPLSPEVVVEIQNHSSGNRYELTLVGVLLTREGENYHKLLTRYLSFLREQFHAAPEKLEFSDKDFSQALKLSNGEVLLLGNLVTLGRLSKGGASSATGWTIRVPDEIEDLPATGPLDRALESLLFRRPEVSSPVVEANWALSNAAFQYPNFIFGQPVVSGNSPLPASTVDALKRRYQVFVSSTYEDLKEERQHVIQALLETKCIPVGMELFPAASVEQWALIKRVIDECDYYIVVVAGRYGSLNDADVSYTEMEFDYALSVGKPVIGFYHKDVGSLPGKKLENTDQARKRLRQFTEKVKGRLCRPWSSAAELGSAVKSAIISELEFNARPGWIRADAVPSTDAVEKLKQRIADLEEKLKKQRSPDKPTFPCGQGQTQIPVDIGYDFKYEDYVDHEFAGKHLAHQYQTTWDGLIVIMDAGLQEGWNLHQFHKFITDVILNALSDVVAKEIGQSKPRYTVCINESDVEIVLKTLMAKKLVKMIAGQRGSWSNPRWRFTPKGLQHSAELHAIRSSG